MRSHLTSLALLLSTTITLIRAQEPACVGLMMDEVCITKTFPTCTATWNGIPCESCTVCGDSEEESSTAYRCEVASLISSNSCNNLCANVECNAGCIGCEIAEQDIADAIANFEQQQQADLEEAVGGSFPVGDDPVVATTPPPTNDTNTETDTDTDSTIPVVIDNNTNEAVVEEEEKEQEEAEASPTEEGEGTPQEEQEPGLDTQTDANDTTEGENNVGNTETGEGESGEENSGAVTNQRVGIVSLVLASLFYFF